jgi:predicted DNA binding protein
MGGRTAEKLEAVVRKADEGDLHARAALDAVNAKAKSIHAAYTEVVKPEAKDSVTMQAHERAARELSASLKQQGIDAEVSRSKTEGKFHLTLRDLTPKQIQVVTKALKVGLEAADAIVTLPQTSC